MQKEFNCLRLDGEEVDDATCQVVEEVPLSIFINGRHFVTAMTSPQLRTEFVTGHLFTERIVAGLKEIESLEIEGNVARAIVSNPMRAIVPRRPIVSGCGGIASFLDESKLPEIKSDLQITRDDIQAAMLAISLSEIHIATGGVHSVGLFDQSGPVCIIEDIGRHNALDKAVGYALARDVDLSRTYVACTGRISSDMALKCSVAGISIIVSRGATTSLAISIAERTGLAIVGFVRGKRLNVYTNRQRIKIRE
jgi:FdhD protein